MSHWVPVPAAERSLPSLTMTVSSFCDDCTAGRRENRCLLRLIIPTYRFLPLPTIEYGTWSSTLSVCTRVAAQDHRKPRVAAVASARNGLVPEKPSPQIPRFRELIGGEPLAWEKVFHRHAELNRPGTRILVWQPTTVTGVSPAAVDANWSPDHEVHA
jgi:hypothetical protein